jgi:hypothetical protein
LLHPDKNKLLSNKKWLNVRVAKGDLFHKEFKNIKKFANLLNKTTNNPLLEDPITI